MMSNQRQQGGDGSLNLQGQTVTYNSGISYADARLIAEDVFSRNALVLAGEARKTAEARATEITEMFLTKLKMSSAATFDALAEPDVQHNLYAAQHGYARSGSTPLAETLVNLLVSRCEAPGTDIESLVLNEAIATMPKITTGQANLLSLNWLLQRARDANVDSVRAHAAELQDIVDPLLDDLPTGRVEVEHLQYAGCISISNRRFTFHDVITATYGELYCDGFLASDVPLVLEPYLKDERVFRKLNAEGSLLRAASDRELSVAGVASLSNDQLGQLAELRRRSRMSKAAVVEAIEEFYPRISTLARLWESSTIRFAELTSVGTALAHANAVRTSKFEGPLSVWINAGD
jgi:hypothetical protein